MKKLSTIAVIVTLAAGAAACSQPEPEMPAGPTVDATTAAIRTINGTVTGYLVQAAADVSEDLYAYRPTDEVRTMGQLFGHVANASFAFCSTASGTAAPERPNAEELATKMEIQAALADSVAFCNAAFDAMTVDNANEAVEIFGIPQTRLGVLAFHNAHINEHYGNIVTYMRANGLVPPSSR